MNVVYIFFYITKQSLSSKQGNNETFYFAHYRRNYLAETNPNHMRKLFR